MKKRVFVAVDISEGARLAVSDYAAGLRAQFPKARVGWEKPEKLHLTMKFLGEIDPERLEDLAAAAARAAGGLSAFALQISGTGVFPSPKKARILWLGVNDETGGLRLLSESLENECEKRGFAREARGFRAHLTVGRLKERCDGLVDAHLRAGFEPVELEVPGIVIYQSELRPGGSVYSVLSRHEFRGRRP